MKWYLVPLIFFAILLLLSFLVKTVPENCECLGIGNSLCIGALNCEQTEIDCTPLTCELKHELLGIIDSTQETSLSYTILIIDASKSMEGENIDATKRAAQEFVKKIKETEYIAIIEFNDQATILSEFSNDKTTLFQSIELINPRGRTEFYEPFQVANNLFESIPSQAQKYILFLSDGAPEDEQEIFMKEILSLKEDDVNMYALAFAGKSNEELMKEIASKDSNLFLVSTAQNIEETFVTIYTDILNEQYIEIKTDEKTKTARSEEEIQTTIHSIHNGVNLLEQTTYCPLQTTNYIEAKKGTVFSRILGTQQEQHISYPLKDLDEGKHDLVAHSKVFLEGCTLSATQQLGTIHIVTEEDCKITCDDIDSTMKGGKNNSYVRANHKSVNWNIFIDKSSSMERSSHLNKAIKNSIELISYMPSYDRVTIGSFDNQVNILLASEHPYTVHENNFESIVPSASTQILIALKKTKELEQTTGEAHTILISDGKYPLINLEELNNTIQSIQGCISTITYGTHLLTTKEPVYELITQERNCGYDFITQPTSEELLSLVNSTISNIPELIITLKEEDQTNTTTLFVETISSFTGEEPLVTNENCQITPITTIDIQTKEGELKSIIGNKFSIKENSSFNITSSFTQQSCSYKTKKIIEHQEEVNNPLIKILAIVSLVLAIHILVFSIVMNKKLKKVKRVLDEHKKR